MLLSMEVIFCWFISWSSCIYLVSQTFSKVFFFFFCQLWVTSSIRRHVLSLLWFFTIMSGRYSWNSLSVWLLKFQRMVLIILYNFWWIIFPLIFLWGRLKKRHTDIIIFIIIIIIFWSCWGALLSLNLQFKSSFTTGENTEWGIIIIIINSCFL